MRGKTRGMSAHNAASIYGADIAFLEPLFEFFFFRSWESVSLHSLFRVSPQLFLSYDRSYIPPASNEDEKAKKKKKERCLEAALSLIWKARFLLVRTCSSHVQMCVAVHRRKNNLAIKTSVEALVIHRRNTFENTC